MQEHKMKENKALTKCFHNNIVEWNVQGLLLLCHIVKSSELRHLLYGTVNISILRTVCSQKHISPDAASYL